MMRSEKAIAAWCEFMEIPVPRVVLGFCPEHGSDAHYCDSTIYLPADEDEPLAAMEIFTYHEFFHYVCDLIRKGVMTAYNEECFCELMADGRFTKGYPEY
jgi:hypothetical protein